jgi:GcrA cell cycle regulator
MQSTDWPPEHCAALREHVARGLSFSQVAKAINASFKTAYTRSATIGRARRMGIARPGRPTEASQHWAERLRKADAMAPRADKPVERVPKTPRPAPLFGLVEPPKLRCVETAPRHLSLLDLEASDCRYPYGGDADGEAITFCGHKRRQGSSYCVPHFHLTRGPGTLSERAAGTVLLRLVAAERGMKPWPARKTQQVPQAAKDTRPAVD